MDIHEKMFYEALRIRMVEESIMDIYPSDKIQSPVHLSIGQEHHIVALCNALKKDDQIYATYRSHAPYLAKGGDMKLMFAELYGKVSGVAKGKAGSMHLCAPELSFMGSSAIVASVFPHAVGAAYAAKVNKKKNISVAISGDGSTEEGVFTECLNFASLKDIPVLFFIENNGLSINTPIKVRQSYVLEKLCAAYGVEYLRADDGFDMDYVYSRTRDIREKMMKKSRPVLFEVITYRYKVHVGISEDYDKGYRERDEYEKWRKRDPLIINKELIDKFKDRINKEIKDAVKFAEKDSFPNSDELLKDIY